MTSSADTLVGQTLDFEAGLQELIARGYRFIHPRDAQGEVLEVVGVRVHDQVIDVVRLSAEDDVTGIRMPGGEKDILSPTRVLWQADGSLDVVLAQILALPDDHTPGSLIIPGEPETKGCWIAKRGGGAKWLAASG